MRMHPNTPPRRRLLGPAQAWRAPPPCSPVLALAGCQPAPDPAWSGYAEGDYLYLGAPVAGTLSELAVQKGQSVAAQAPLFRLDDTPAPRAETEAQSNRPATRPTTEQGAARRRSRSPRPNWPRPAPTSRACRDRGPAQPRTGGPGLHLALAPS
jgi:hypothetical protein